ncbi:MAG: polysaccharide biosynthesis tyrosine autokinase [Anaerolineae bacterium]|nr:polysaccharide biosynthesis tyrosine autokinase [Anaerolineae bacterium]
MNLSQYLQILWRRRKIIIATALAATITVIIGRLMKPQTYTASATIRIPTLISGSEDYFDYELSYSDRIMNTYVAIATSSPVLVELQDRLAIPKSEMPSVSAKAINDTELLELTVQSTNPELAQNAANTLADIMVSQRGLRNRLYIVQPAGLPRAPGLIDTAMVVVIGVVVGLFGGAGLAFLYDGIDTRVQTEDEIAALTELPILATLPVAHDETWSSSGYLADTYPHRESFIRLGTNILMRKEEFDGAMCLLVTSANPQEGKSTISANLAITIAQAGQRVVLIDADMRRPALHNFFGYSSDNGLSTLLTGQTGLDDVLQSTSVANLDLITSGQTPHNPNLLLGSEAMSELLATLKSQVDIVMIDTPAYLAVADATSLAMLVDGVILVASRGDVRRKDVLEVREQLAAARSNLLGVVINRAEYDVPRPYRKYYQPSDNSLGEEETVSHPPFL